MKTITTLALLFVSVYGMAASETMSAFDVQSPSAATPQLGATETISLKLEDQPISIWEHGVGEGFRRGLWHAGFSLGGSIGVQIFGGSEDHDLALATIHVGRTIGGVRGEGHWYRGNWDLLGEAFGARQFSPGEGYVAGITPILRYHFATGTRWIPFVEAGAGVSGTTISGPDLAGGFQFHLLAGAGLQWFYRDHVAVGFEYRLGHVSDAGTRSPNLGLNTNELLLGVTWFF